MPLAYRRVALAAYALLLVTLTHLPRTTLEQFDITLWDKAKHTIAYTILGGLVAWSFPAIRRSAARIALAWAGLLAFAAADELSQLIVDRSPEWADWLADGIGAALGLAGTSITMTGHAALKQPQPNRAAVTRNGSR